MYYLIYSTDDGGRLVYWHNGEGGFTGWGGLNGATTFLFQDIVRQGYLPFNGEAPVGLVAEHFVEHMFGFLKGEVE